MSEFRNAEESTSRKGPKGSGLFTDEGFARLSAAFAEAVTDARRENERLRLDRVEEKADDYGVGKITLRTKDS